MCRARSPPLRSGGSLREKPSAVQTPSNVASTNGSPAARPKDAWVFPTPGTALTAPALTVPATAPPPRTLSPELYDVRTKLAEETRQRVAADSATFVEIRSLREYVDTWAFNHRELIGLDQAASGVSSPELTGLPITETGQKPATRNEMKVVLDQLAALRGLCTEQAKNAVSVREELSRERAARESGDRSVNESLSRLARTIDERLAKAERQAFQAHTALKTETVIEDVCTDLGDIRRFVAEQGIRLETQVRDLRAFVQERCGDGTDVAGASLDYKILLENHKPVIDELRQTISQQGAEIEGLAAAHDLASNAQEALERMVSVIGQPSDEQLELLAELGPQLRGLCEGVTLQHGRLRTEIEDLRRELVVERPLLRSSEARPCACEDQCAESVGLGEPNGASPSGTLARGLSCGPGRSGRSPSGVALPEASSPPHLLDQQLQMERADLPDSRVGDGSSLAPLERASPEPLAAAALTRSRAAGQGRTRQTTALGLKEGMFDEEHMKTIKEAQKLMDTFRKCEEATVRSFAEFRRPGAQSAPRDCF